jgi:hypothetical protein
MHTRSTASLPDSTTKWTVIKAERRAIVNLTRKFGFVMNDARRLAWLKTVLHSDRDQERILSLGFTAMRSGVYQRLDPVYQ